MRGHLAAHSTCERQGLRRESAGTACLPVRAGEARKVQCRHGSSCHEKFPSGPYDEVYESRVMWVLKMFL